MKKSILLLTVIGLLATLKPTEAAYRMSTYKGYTLISWINPLKTYATYIKTYVGYIRAQYWKLWGILNGRLTIQPGSSSHYGDELADAIVAMDLPDMKFLDLDDLPDIEAEEKRLPSE